MAGKITFHGNVLLESDTPIGRLECLGDRYNVYYTLAQSDGGEVQIYSVIADTSNIERRLDIPAVTKAVDAIRSSA